MTELSQHVKNFLESISWQYEHNEEYAFFDTGVGLDSEKLEYARIVVDYASKGILQSYAILQRNVPEDKRDLAAQYLMRANFGLKFGNFELDFGDGEVRYHMYISCAQGFLPNERMMQELLFIGPAMLDRYGEGLYKVLDGRATPAQAIARVESKEE